MYGRRGRQRPLIEASIVIHCGHHVNSQTYTAYAQRIASRAHCCCAVSRLQAGFKSQAQHELLVVSAAARAAAAAADAASIRYTGTGLVSQPG